MRVTSLMTVENTRSVDGQQSSGFSLWAESTRRLGALKIPGLTFVRSYEAHFAQVYATLPRSVTGGVVFKRRASAYAKQRRASAETRDWLKRRFGWDYHCKSATA